MRNSRPDPTPHLLRQDDDGREKTLSREGALLIATRVPGEARMAVEESLVELGRLADSAGARVVGEVIQERKAKDPRYVIGEGKAWELRASYEGRIDMVVFDGDLSGSQQRNLEEVLGCRVLDRSALILDIFAQRAQSREGKMQVELAQLEYLLTRLVRRHSSLSRLGGGIGTRGPGEPQLESDRRRIRQRMVRIRTRLEGVRRSRGIMRKNRQRKDLPVVGLVGYTNAGKSTLFNALTRAGAAVQDRFFVTLDPTMRRLWFSDGQIALLTDTVGFIRKLPYPLIHAFRATLEELSHADLLLHIVDASHPHREEQIRAVQEVLGEIGAADRPTLLVYNKIDRLQGPQDLFFPHSKDERIAVSAATGEGIDCLRRRLHSLLFAETASFSSGPRSP